MNLKYPIVVDNKIFLVILISFALVSCASAVIVAASDSSAEWKAVADYVCDGVNDQAEINAAFGDLPDGGGILNLSPGTFHIADEIYPKTNGILSGQMSTTDLHFSAGSFHFTSTTNVTIRNFNFTGSGYMFISSSHIYVRNVTAYEIDNSSIATFYVYNWAGATTIEDIEFTNVTASNNDRWCFVHDSEVGGSTIKDVIYTNCQAINCGRYAQYVDPGSPSESWDVGFDIAERTNLVQNVTYENCHVSGSWESGFHTENMPTVQDIKIYNSTSTNNCQKQKTGWGSCEFGAGFQLRAGTNCTNCTSADNWRGFRFTGGGNLTNSRDYNSTIGIYYYPVTYPSFVTNVTITNATKGVQTYGSMSGILVFDYLTVISNTFQTGSAFGIDAGTTYPSNIYINDSVLNNYYYGIRNLVPASDVNVCNVSFVNTTVDYNDCLFCGESTPTPTTPVPTTTAPLIATNIQLSGLLSGLMGEMDAILNAIMNIARYAIVGFILFAIVGIFKTPGRMALRLLKRR